MTDLGSVRLSKTTKSVWTAAVIITATEEINRALFKIIHCRCQRQNEFNGERHNGTKDTLDWHLLKSIRCAVQLPRPSASLSLSLVFERTSWTFK